MPQKSIGLIEFKGLTGAIAAADAAAKAAEVDLAACEVTTGACVMLRIEGDLTAVQTALEAATIVARKLGQFLTSKVIPRPHEGLGLLLSTRGYHNHLHPLEPKRPTAPKTSPEPKSALEKEPEATPPPPKLEPKPAPKPKPEPKPAPKPVAKPKVVVESPPIQKQPPAQPAPRPQPTVAPKPQAIEKTAPPPTATDRPTIAELEKMPVVKLRQYARSLANLPIQGREISMANKSQLLEAILSTLTV